MKKKSCLYCGHIHSYDNRDGKLANIYYARLRELTMRHAELKQTTPVTPARPVLTVSAPAVIAPAYRTIPEQTTLPAYDPKSDLQQKSVQKRIKQTGQPFHFSLRKSLLIAAMSFLFIGISLTIFIFNFSHILVSDADVHTLVNNMQNQIPNVIYDRNGVKISELARYRTGTLTFEQIPGHFRELLLSAEDKNFYHHNGTDLLAFTRAFVTNMVTMRYSQGASTITQQLVRAATGERRKSVFRKIREISIALALERIL